jgi:hypothetical protein
LPVRCLRFHPEFCCIRVRVIGLRLLYSARFSTESYTRGCHWIPRLCSLEALACVWPMAFLSGVHCLTGWHCKFRPNTEGRSSNNFLGWHRAWLRVRVRVRDG